VRTEFVFQRTLPANYVFQVSDKLCLFQIDLFISVEEPHVCLQRKSCVLEAEPRSTLFPCVISRSFGKEDVLSTRILKVEKGKFCST
jgi:hypothetical protein